MSASLFDAKHHFDSFDESSHRESLLLSPFCSKRSPQDTLQDYLQPHLNRTEEKKIRRRSPEKVSCLKRTEPDNPDEEVMARCQQLEQTVARLKQALRDRDQRIAYLQTMHSQRGKKKQPEASSQKQWVIAEEPSYEARVASLKKQVVFLTHNNQELFQEMRSTRAHCDELKRILAKTIEYNRELESNMKGLCKQVMALEEANERLSLEKEEMMASGKEELRLFRKMKRVWEEQTRRAKGERLPKNTCSDI